MTAALRRAAGLLKRELADRVDARLQADGLRGFDVTYLSKIERERVEPPSTAALLALAAELGVDGPSLVARGGHVPAELAAMLAASPAARAFVAAAHELGLDDDDWAMLTDLVLAVKARREGSGDPGW